MLYIFFIFHSFFNESTAIYLLPYCCTVKSSCSEQTGGFRELIVSVRRMLVCMHEENSFPSQIPIWMPVFIIIIWFATRPRGGWATLEMWNVPCAFFLLRGLSEDRRRWHGRKTKKAAHSSGFFCFVFLFHSEDFVWFWVAFRVKNCCLVLNLKWSRVHWIIHCTLTLA